MMDYPETSGNLRKPAAAVSSRFPDILINKKSFDKIRKTCRKPPRPVFGGFHQFSSSIITIHVVKNLKMHE